MIQIDMPMPDSCAECPLKTVEEDLYGDHFYYCPIIKAAIRGKKRHIKRYRHCPLKEVVEPKANCTDCILDGTDACSRGAGRAVDDEICEDFLKGE